MLKSRLAVVQNAIDVVARHLDGLSPSRETARLRAQLEECATESARLSSTQAISPARTEVMKRVLAVHVEVMDLERRAARPETTKLACS